MQADQKTQQYLRRMLRASSDEFMKMALTRAIKRYRSNKSDAFALFPDSVEKAERLREIREHSLLHIEELVKEVKDRAEDLHWNFHLARTAEDALDYIGGLVTSGDMVVKAKSMTSEEIHLNDRLEEVGADVYETDLGAFIVQQLKVKPMHILSPAVHVPREKVAELLSELLGRKIEPDIGGMVREVRALLRQKYIDAKVGITGANVIAAETATVFLIGNEGNIRLVSGLPDKHIVLAGLEKLVPTLQDAMLQTEVTVRYANYKFPSYVNLVAGPSKTGDIEKQTTYGAHGPLETYMVLLDNERTSMIKDDVYRQALYCVRCGGCLYECPVYPLTAGHFGHVYMGGIGAALTRFLSGGIEEVAPMAYTDTQCGRCVDLCPMKIDIPAIVMKLREELAEKGYVPSRIVENLKDWTGLEIEPGST